MSNMKRVTRAEFYSAFANLNSVSTAARENGVWEVMDKNNRVIARSIDRELKEGEVSDSYYATDYYIAVS